MAKEEDLTKMAKGNPEALIAILGALEFRYKLKAFRAMFGASLDDVSQRLGVSIQFLSSVERGKQKATMNLLGRIKKAYGADLNVLYESMGTQPKE